MASNHGWAFDHHLLVLAQICNYGRGIFNFPTIWELNLLNLNEHEASCNFDVQPCGVCWESELVWGEEKFNFRFIELETSMRH